MLHINFFPGLKFSRISEIFTRHSSGVTPVLFYRQFSLVRNFWTNRITDDYPLLKRVKFHFLQLMKDSVQKQAVNSANKLLLILGLHNFCVERTPWLTRKWNWTHRSFVVVWLVWAEKLPDFLCEEYREIVNTFSGNNHFWCKCSFQLVCA